ncbi:MAG: ArsB/NhaD family transporter [Methanobacteriota archaeon]|nr:MAG: ArsB/NhaD family transporter [Euryarchaeota archaeon]
MATEAQIVAAVIFVFTFVLIATERLHRTSSALFGAALMVIAGEAMGFYRIGMPPDTAAGSAFLAIDYNTIGLLFGMMVIVGVIMETGFFEYLAVKIAKIARGDLWKILMMFVVVTAVASAFLDNVTTILLMIPITISISNSLEINPMPFIMAEILASNIGGAATVIGDPPNIMIASAAGIPFMTFLINIGPIIIVTMLVSLFLLKRMYREDLKQEPKHIEVLMERDERKEIKNMPLLKKSMIVLGVIIALFMFHHVVHIQLSIIALMGAVFLLVWGNIHPREAFQHVHWSTLLFFVGLFVLVGGLVTVGIMDAIAEGLGAITGGNIYVALILVIWISAFASTIVDNIPFTATMIPVVAVLAETIPAPSGVLVHPLWWGLAIGACLGGNGSLVGASANLVGAGISEKFGHHISFRAFFTKAFPFMVITLTVATILLLFSVFVQMNI